MPHKECRIWTKAGDDDFSIKSTYETLTRTPFISNPHWREIWKLQIHKRHGLFLWRIDRVSIPIATRLAACIPSFESSCQVYGNLVESLSHLFFNCNFVITVWFSGAFGRRWEILEGDSSVALIQKVLDVNSEVKESLKSDIFVYHAVAILEAIWSHRNIIILWNAKKLTDSMID